MVRLTRLLGYALRWVRGTPRRMIATIALPALVIIALLTPGLRSDGDPNTADGALATGGSTPSSDPAAASGSAANTGPPPTQGPAPTSAPVAPRPAPNVPPEPAAAANAYVTAVNTHDARPGKDADFYASYKRAQALMTPELFKVVTAPSRRGDYLWGQWTKDQSRVGVEPLAVAVPDGAPVPSPTEVYLRVRFTQTVQPGVPGAKASSTQSAINLVVTKGTDDAWRVSKLLADI